MKSASAHRILIVMLATLLAWSSINGPPQSFDGVPEMSTAVSAGVTPASDETEFVLSSSEDGKTIYMWQFISGKPPRYIGKADAVIQQ